MSENPIHAELSQAEWRLVEAIRALPESSLRERANEVFGDLIYYLQNARCQGMGPEGFPCGEPRSSCDECHEVWDLLDLVSQRVKA